LNSLGSSATVSVRIFSNTTAYLSCLGYMFRPLFGRATGNCIKLFKIKVKAYIKCTLSLSDLKNSVFVEKCSLAIINVQLC